MVSYPAASVVVPTFNQASRLAMTLTSLAHQRNVGGPWELIVVDDGSTDETPSVIGAFAGVLPLRAVRQDNAGRSVARNVGAGLAQAPCLVFCDGDRICGPAFLSAHMAAATTRAPGTISLGEIREVYFGDLDQVEQKITADIDTGCSWLAGRSRRPHFVAEIYRHMLEPAGETRSSLAWLCFLSGNVSLSREFFMQAGGFDEDFVEWGFEHFELGYRLARRGGVFQYCADAINYHVAHRRPAGSYEAGITASAALLRLKHHEFPVDPLASLTRGEMTLTEFLAASAHGA